jgi:hypothetical protein
MVLKAAKIAVIGAGVTRLIGALVFGKDVVSYLASSETSVRSAIKDNVPIEFELRRVCDLLDQIIPQMHANIYFIAVEDACQ